MNNERWFSSDEVFGYQKVCVVVLTISTKDIYYMKLSNQSKADDILLNTDDVLKLIDDFRLALKHAGSFDFDDPGAVDNETYKTITGLDQGTLFNYSQCFSVRLFWNFRSF